MQSRIYFYEKTGSPTGTRELCFHNAIACHDFRIWRWIYTDKIKDFVYLDWKWGFVSHSECLILRPIGAVLTNISIKYNQHLGLTFNKTTGTCFTNGKMSAYRMLSLSVTNEIKICDANSFKTSSWYLKKLDKPLDWLLVKYSRMTYFDSFQFLSDVMEIEHVMIKNKTNLRSLVLPCCTHGSETPSNMEPSTSSHRLEPQ